MKYSISIVRGPISWSNNHFLLLSYLFASTAGGQYSNLNIHAQTDIIAYTTQFNYGEHTIGNIVIDHKSKSHLLQIAKNIRPEGQGLDLFQMPVHQ